MKISNILVALVLGLGLTLTLALLLRDSARAATIMPDPHKAKAELLDATPIHYVATTGIDSGDCGTPISACLTVQYAVDQAGEDNEIRIAAGSYAGVSAREGVTQVVYISKTVAVRGGYTTTNSFAGPPDPAINPTILDAQRLGRVLVINTAWADPITTTVEGLHITGGDAERGGGGANVGGNGGGVLVRSAHITVSNSWILSNTATQGGGLFLWYSKATMVGNTIYENEADNGGGVYLWTGSNSVLLSDNIIANNMATQWGGGVHLWDTFRATLDGNSILSNTAQQYGGGIWLNFSSANLQNNIVHNNQAITGGGIYLRAINSTPLTNNVIISNQASASGGGLYVTGGNLHLLHNTFARNSSGDGSGVYVDTYSGSPAIYSTVALTNSILVSHTVGITVTSGNTMTVNGILWYESPITVSAGVTATVSVRNQHTALPAFAADGYHLTAESAAIDAGVDTAVVVDIDGDKRPIGRPDLGADEWGTHVHLPLVLREYP